MCGLVGNLSVHFITILRFPFHPFSFWFLFSCWSKHGKLRYYCLFSCKLGKYQVLDPNENCTGYPLNLGVWTSITDHFGFLESRIFVSWPTKRYWIFTLIWVTDDFMHCILGAVYTHSLIPYNLYGSSIKEWFTAVDPNHAFDKLWFDTIPKKVASIGRNSWWLYFDTCPKKFLQLEDIPSGCIPARALLGHDIPQVGFWIIDVDHSPGPFYNRKKLEKSACHGFKDLDQLSFVPISQNLLLYALAIFFGLVGRW